MLMYTSIPPADPKAPVSLPSKPQMTHETQYNNSMVMTGRAELWRYVKIATPTRRAVASVAEADLQEVLALAVVSVPVEDLPAEEVMLGALVVEADMVEVVGMG